MSELERLDLEALAALYGQGEASRLQWNAYIADRSLPRPDTDSYFAPVAWFDAADALFNAAPELLRLARLGQEVEEARALIDRWCRTTTPWNRGLLAITCRHCGVVKGEEHYPDCLHVLFRAYLARTGPAGAGEGQTQ